MVVTITRTNAWAAYSGTFAEVVAALDAAGITKSQVVGITYLSATTMLALTKSG